jgi:hypothetical protein
VDDEFETQDAERKVCGQASSAEYDIIGQSAPPPSCQDRLRNLLYTLIDGTPVRHRGLYTDGSTEARDGVDEMVGEGRHIPIATGRAAVEIAVADRLDHMLRDDQCLFGTDEFVEGRSHVMDSSVSAGCW